MAGSNHPSQTEVLSVDRQIQAEKYAGSWFINRLKEGRNPNLIEELRDPTASDIESYTYPNGIVVPLYNGITWLNKSSGNIFELVNQLTGQWELAGGKKVSDYDGRIITLETTTNVYEIFEVIGTSATGTITIPNHATIITGRYGLDASSNPITALVLELSGGYPIDVIARDSLGDPITVTSINTTTGEYVLSATPLTNVAFVYHVSIQSQYVSSSIPITQIIEKYVSQSIVKYGTVAVAEAQSVSLEDVIYIYETETFYQTTTDVLTPDSLWVLSVGDGSLKKGVAGKYSLQNVPGSITTTSQLKTAISQIEDSISEQTITGFSSWDSAGPYYSIVGNDLTLLVSGKGRIKGKEYSWTAPQTITLPSNSTSFIYIDVNGVIGLSNTATLSLYQNNITLFEVLNEGTEIDVVFENHPYNFGTVESSRHLHFSIGTIFVPPAYDTRAIGANPTRITTGTGSVITDRQIKLVGSTYLEDHGIYTLIPDSAGSAITWRFFYTNSLGQWKKYVTQSQFPMVYNNAGTVTALTTSGTNHVGIFRIYASKADPNTGNPFYFAVMDNAAYGNIILANNAITNGLPAVATNELSELEVAQIGYVIVENNGTSGYIREIVIEKQTNTGGVTVSAPSNSHILLTDRDAIDSHPSYAVSHTRLDTTLETVEDSLHRKEKISSDSLEPTGYSNRFDSIMTWDHPTRTMSIQPAVTQYDYWVKGYNYIETTLKQKQISTVNGLHYIYFLEDQTLFDDEYPPTDQLLKGVALSMFVYWNNIQGIAPHVGEERHGMVMDWADHNYKHFRFGAVYISGLGLSGFTIGSGALDSHAQFACADGVIYDEDIEHDIVNNTPQQLSTILRAPVLFRVGTDLWYRTEADNFPIIYSGKQGYVAGSITTIFTGANGRPAYNQLVAGSWQLTEIGQDELFLIHLFATNDIYYPVIAILGINIYTKIKDAQNAAYTEIQSLTGLPFVEFTPIGSIIYQGNNTYLNSVNARIIQTDMGADYIDFRDTETFRGISASLPALYYGDYTPTLTNVANVASSTTYPSGYKGIGMELSVHGEVSITTTAAVSTQFRLTIPIASLFGFTYELSGTGQESTGLFGVSVRADTTNNEAIFTFIAPAAATYIISYIFGYVIQ